jgi:hypothetical protein
LESIEDEVYDAVNRNHDEHTNYTPEHCILGIRLLGTISDYQLDNSIKEIQEGYGKQNFEDGVYYDRIKLVQERSNAHARKL